MGFEHFKTIAWYDQLKHILKMVVLAGLILGGLYLIGTKGGTLGYIVMILGLLLGVSIGLFSCMQC